MSMTFTLPVSSAEAFKHGRTQSNSRSHQRQRVNSRLAPPFPLPRIPSESLVQHENHEDHFGFGRHEHSHPMKSNYTPFQTHSSIPIPISEPDGLPLGQRESPAPSAPNMRSNAYVPKQRHVSRPTQMLLDSTQNYSLLHGIIEEKDSRRIFYFMCLNLVFMVIQSTYGFLTGSLGLISDSIHMFFDCIALLVGVCAAVMAKWPASSNFPYGYGKIDTLAGLGNGIFLMLISVEIVYEAVERLFVGSDLQRTMELLIVSILGLIVNIVGILCFDHGHHHGHGHSHGGHGHSHDQLHDHSLPGDEHGHGQKSHKAGGHSHHHGGENMQGIYLHIMADALGSVSVIISTLLVQWTGWSGFDPLASCTIAILIFASSVPLVISTARTLLLSLNSDVEYNLRDILGGINDIKGVVGYTVPKFWLEDIGKKEDAHDHSHSHDHDYRPPHLHNEQDHHTHHHDHDHHHHHKDSTDDHKKCSSDDPAVLGVIHLIASAQADLTDVRERSVRYLKSKNMDVIVQVESEGEGRCWCGGGPKSA